MAACVTLFTPTDLSFKCNVGLPGTFRVAVCAAITACSWLAAANQEASGFSCNVGVPGSFCVAACAAGMVVLH